MAIDSKTKGAALMSEFEKARDEAHLDRIYDPCEWCGRVGGHEVDCDAEVAEGLGKLVNAAD